MNLNNVFGYIAKSGAKVGIIIGNSNTFSACEKMQLFYADKPKLMVLVIFIPTVYA
jgi:hypothetical protein